MQEILILSLVDWWTGARYEIPRRFWIWLVGAIERISRALGAESGIDTKAR